MNLFDLIAKGNPRLARSEGVSFQRIHRNGKIWRGASIAAGGALYVEQASECHPFKGRAASIGWYVQALGGQAHVAVSFVAGDCIVSTSTLTVTSEGFDPVLLPWSIEPMPASFDLKIDCDGPSPIFIASHFEIDRKALIARCKGRGIELGPGPNPHVRPSEKTEVLYLEQKGPAEWVKLYGEHYQMAFDPDLAPFYIVGDAHEIPVETASLDFIYSSHVFEHLANPIGHLQLWSVLLRKGGELLMVIPDYVGSKDYLADPTAIGEMVAEYCAEDFEPSLHHYERFARSRKTPGKGQELREKRSSIHVHFYSNHNMRELLDYAVEAGYFERYAILHCANAKDFHVIVKR